YYWDYFLFDTSKGDDPAKYPLAFQELADSSPFASQQRMMTAEMDKFFHDGAASRGFANAEMDRVFLPVVYSTSMTWNCYKVDGDSFATNTENPSTQNNVNSTSLIALWRCNGFFYCLGYSTANSMLYSTAIKESDGTCAWENVIIGSNLNPYYLNSFCVDPVEEMAYLVTADNDSDAYTGQYPSMLSVSFANEKMSMKGMVKAYWPEFTPKGRMKKTISIGDVVIVLQGNYSDGSGFSEFRYHIFDKVQSLWEVETSLTQNIIRANAVSQNYWTLYSYSEYFTSEVIGADIYLYGHGLGHIGTGTDDLKKWQSQTLSLVTGMLLGVAESKQTNGKIQIVLSGNVPLHSDYAKTFKNIDHTTIGGNKATLLGSVAMLPGIGA
ncbi:MAG: hypothetical protein KJ658_10435, partial [Proteobacteria bacterium]|nr:hypothetical protein [Pseudomonadota bacterium]